MKHRPKEPGWLPNRRVLPVVSLAAIGLLSPPQSRSEPAAESLDVEARLRPRVVFQTAARADYASVQGQGVRRDAIVGTAHLRFGAAARPIVAGLMIEYRFGEERAGTMLVAGTFTLKLPKWTAAVSPFYKRTTQRAAGEWDYWGNARRHIANRHALGVELFGDLESGRSAKWMVGYYGTITERLSVSVAAGSRFDARSNRVAAAVVTWRPRPAGR